MTDIPEMPPGAEEDLTIHSQPTGSEAGQLFSTLPIEAPDHEDAEEILHEDNFKTAGIRALLPNALAKEERSARLRKSRARRRSGVALTTDEIQEDLNKIMSHLSSHFSLHLAGKSAIFKLPAQAILYAERKTFYAMTDYPRVFENDIVIMSLWDTLERIHMTAIEWRKDDKRGDGRRVIVSMERMAKAAMRSVLSPPDEDDKMNAENVPRDPES